MTAYSYSDVLRDFNTVLDSALIDDVFINRNDGNLFKLSRVIPNKHKSVLDVEGINTKVTTQDIINALHECHAQEEL